MANHIERKFLTSVTLQLLTEQMKLLTRDDEARGRSKFRFGVNERTFV